MHGITSYLRGKPKKGKTHGEKFLNIGSSFLTKLQFVLRLVAYGLAG